MSTTHRLYAAQWDFEAQRFMEVAHEGGQYLPILWYYAGCLWIPLSFSVQLSWLGGGWHIQSILKSWQLSLHSPCPCHWCWSQPEAFKQKSPGRTMWPPMPVQKFYLLLILKIPPLHTDKEGVSSHWWVTTVILPLSCPLHCFPLLLSHAWM